MLSRRVTWRGDRAGGAVAGAQLAVDAAAPGVDLAVLQQGQAEVAAGGDLLDLGHALDLLGDASGVAGVVVAELPVGVVSPGEHVPGRVHSEGVSAAGGDVLDVGLSPGLEVGTPNGTDAP